ncbi:MAG: DUF924 domain-containing protein [Polyangiaceae bacterium]|nr:DUF924 domain-containing protein [Polyangiaceae bacterium]
MHPSSEDVLLFWFGELDEHGLATKDATTKWFMKNPAFDEEVRSRFGDLHAAIARGEKESWLDDPRGRLAYVVVLDQLSRNMFRGDKQMFAADERALAAAAAGVEKGHDHPLACAERIFLYMPFMHSESLDAQDRCVELFRTFADGLSGAAKNQVLNNVDYAVRHRDIVARFGRFPHRNELLGRSSTDEEAAFLKEPGSSF